MIKIKDYEINIRNSIAKAMELYYVNSVIQQDDYEDKMIIILSDLLDNAVTFALCKRRGYSIKKEQFNRYKWSLEHCGLKEFTVFKIIGDVAKMIDDDEYYWKPKE